MMLHHRAISRAFAVCCALASVVSACAAPGSTASSTPTADTPGSQSDSTAPTDSTPTTDPTAPARYVSPLDTFLGFGNGKQPTEAQLAEQDQKTRELEQQIATCMQALGFEYIAVEPTTDARRNRKEAFMSMPPGDFAAQYGYGITTMDFEEPGSVNANDAIVLAMSIPERSAYFQALYGSLITIDANGLPVKGKGGDQAPPRGGESCAEKADIAVFGPPSEADPASQDDGFVALRDSFDVLNDSIHNDPRITTAMTAWTACMEAKGHPGYTSFDAGQSEVKTRADTVIGDKTPSEVDPAALSELRAFEIAVATDEYQCSIPYETVHNTVQTEVENAFIAEHRAELEQYRDAIVAGTAGKG